MSTTHKHAMRGAAAGLVGGLAASWLMNMFLAGPGKELEHAVLSDQEIASKQRQQHEREQRGEPKIDATMLTADAIVNAATGGEHLSLEGKKKGGPIVHYAFGGLMGAVYGALAEYSPTVRSGMGTFFGGTLFAAADLVAVPALKLGPPPTEGPALAQSPHFAAHLVYGFATDIVRRAVRKML